MAKNPNSNIIIVLKVLGQICLLPLIAFSAFGFLASFEYTGINVYHVVYAFLFALLSYVFIKLSQCKLQKLISYCLIAIIGGLLIYRIIEMLYRVTPHSA